MAEKELTDKQRRFVEEYLVDLNATQAAIRAGYSKKTAEVQAHQLLKKTLVSKAIHQAMEARSERTAITADMVLVELGRIGFSNMSHYAHWNDNGVSLLDSNDLTEDAARCVAEVSQTVTEAGGSIKFKLHDKVGALDKIARHLGMYKEQVELGGRIQIGWMNANADN